MKIAIKYKLPPNFSSIFKISKIGNSYGFCPDVNGDSNILIGPHWYIFLITFAFFSTLLYFFNKYYLIPSNILILIYIERMFYIMWATTYTLTSIKNPGYPKTNLESIRGSKQMSYCDKCELWYRPKSKTYHCKNVIYVLKDIDIIVLLLGIVLEGKIRKNFIFLSCYLYCTFFIYPRFIILIIKSRKIKNNKYFYYINNIYK